MGVLVKVIERRARARPRLEWCSEHRSWVEGWSCRLWQLNLRKRWPKNSSQVPTLHSFVFTPHHTPLISRKWSRHWLPASSHVQSSAKRLFLGCVTCPRPQKRVTQPTGLFTVRGYFDTLLTLDRVVQSWCPFNGWTSTLAGLFWGIMKLCTWSDDCRAGGERTKLSFWNTKF